MARRKKPAEVGLLRDIQEHPDDDTPRLIFADWQEEHGEPERADLIRVQVELAGEVESEQRRQVLRAREAALLETHGAAWTGPLAGLVRSWRFSRGFVERVTLTPADFVEQAPALFDHAPLRHAVFVDARPGLADLLACPHLARLATLDFRDSGLDADDIGKIAEAAHLTNLQGLILRLNAVEEAGAASLAASPYLRNLTTLDLYDANMTPAAVAALAASPVCGRLTRLVLGGNDLEGGAIALANSPHLASLSFLHLAWTHIGNDDAMALAESPDLPGLRVLDLGHNAIGAPGGRSLAESEHRRGLSQLRLTGNRIGKARKALEDRFGSCVLF